MLGNNYKFRRRDKVYAKANVLFGYTYQIVGTAGIAVNAVLAMDPNSNKIVALGGILGGTLAYIGGDLVKNKGLDSLRFIELSKELDFSNRSGIEQKVQDD